MLKSILTGDCEKTSEFFISLMFVLILVREPVIGLIKWLRPKGLKVCSYVEKCAEFKNQTLKKSAGTQTCYVQQNIPGYAISQNIAKWDYPCRFILKNHVISVVKCKFWQQTIYNDQCSI